MSSTLVNFLPSATAAFQFQPTLAGSQYNVTVTWNTFGQRYYINLTDLSGNLILCRALTSSGPSIPATLSWANGTATAVTAAPHNVPLGSVAAVVISQTETAFDGSVQVLSTDTQTLTYTLMSNPAATIAGVVNFSLNLVAGYIDAWLLFHEETQQFEF